MVLGLPRVRLGSIYFTRLLQEKIGWKSDWITWLVWYGFALRNSYLRSWSSHVSRRHFDLLGPLQSSKAVSLTLAASTHQTTFHVTEKNNLMTHGREPKVRLV